MGKGLPKDDSRSIQLPSKFLDIVGCSFLRIKRERGGRSLWSVGTSEAQQVGTDYSKAELQEKRYLISPSAAEIRPAMNLQALRRLGVTRQSAYKEDGGTKGIAIGFSK